jgi:hypothetical protein
MIRKSGYRFSEKDHAQMRIERNDDSKKSHYALDLNRFAFLSLEDTGLP